MAVIMACFLFLFATGCSYEYEAERAKQEVDVEQEDVSAAEETASSYTAVIDVIDYGTITVAHTFY